MKTFIQIAATMFLGLNTYAQHSYIGKIYSADNREAIYGISISLGGSGKLLAVSDYSGVFSFNSPQNEIQVRLTGMGYTTVHKTLFGGADTVYIDMNFSNKELDEVVISTGYERIPKERATGSFTYIDAEVLNRSVATGLIARLEGVTSSLQFDRRSHTMRTMESSPGLRVRGVSTINSDKSPLIVVDNFPYEGDIEQLNPNDVQEVIVLKDAAAASIWGARAANGVIVITTKRGKLRQPLSLSLNSTVSIRQKPDLNYDPRFLISDEFIEVEKTLFSRNYYDSRINNANMARISPVVELLDRNRKGLLSDQQLEDHLRELSRIDYREQASQFLYREAVNQQYSISASGGADKVSYRFSAGYDNNLTEMVRNTYSRITLSSETTIRPSPVYELSMGLNYAGSLTENNGISAETAAGYPYPYMLLADAQGNALSLPQNHRLSYAHSALTNGLLDWEYRPLDEIRMGDNRTSVSALRLYTGIRLNLLKDLALDMKYQFQSEKQNSRNIQKKETYYVRDLVNRFTQTDGKMVFPNADILNHSISDQVVHNGRLQLSYSPISSGITLIGGVEIRQNYRQGNAYTLYNYDHDVLTASTMLDYTTFFNTRPQSTSRIPSPYISLSEIINRYVSYFGNGSYSWKKRYIFSGSLRWDASNLFGVKTNQKGTPLWSTGFRWKLSEEDFYSWDKLSELSVRTTYGFNGNVNTSAAAFPVLRYATSPITGNPLAYVRNPGEPALRWEKTGVINMAIDFKTVNNGLSGSIEYYIKNAKDLLGRPLLDPTVGYKPNDTQMVPLYNYASLKTKGVDIILRSNNLQGKLSWSTDYFFNWLENKVTHYETIGTVSAINYTYNSSAPPVVGKSLDALFSLPWAGLDPLTGDPLVNQEGRLTKNYSPYLGSLDLSDLIYSGVNFPRFQAGLRNTISYKGLSVSFNLFLKAGYVFRRSSIAYTSLFDSGMGHRDFLNRWQKPGDELITQIPSMPEASIVNRDNIYTQSTALIEKGDHLRWQDFNLSYQLPPSLLWKFGSARAFFYTSNLGIIWRANDHGLDPDYIVAALLPGKNFSFGFQLTF